MIFNPFLLEGLRESSDSGNKSQEQIDEEFDSTIAYYSAQSKGKNYSESFYKNSKVMSIETPLDYIKCQVRSLRGIVYIPKVFYEVKESEKYNEYYLYLSKSLPDYNVPLSSMINDFNAKNFCSKSIENKYNGFWNWLTEKKEYDHLIIFDNDSYFKPSKKSSEIC